MNKGHELSPAWCEMCGEDAAYYFGGHAAMCRDCLETAVRDVFAASGLGDPCGRLLVSPAGLHSICIEQNDTEHDHEH